MIREFNTILCLTACKDQQETLYTSAGLTIRPAPALNSAKRPNLISALLLATNCATTWGKENSEMTIKRDLRRGIDMKKKEQGCQLSFGPIFSHSGNCISVRENCTSVRHKKDDDDTHNIYLERSCNWISYSHHPDHQIQER